MTFYYYLDAFYTHFLCFVLFVRVKSYHEKKTFKTFKKNVQNWPNDLIYITTGILKIYTLC